MSSEFRTKLVEEFDDFYKRKGKKRTTQKGIASVRIRIKAETILDPAVDEYVKITPGLTKREAWADLAQKKLWAKFKKWSPPRAEAHSKKQRVWGLDSIDASSDELAYTWVRTDYKAGSAVGRLEKGAEQFLKKEIRAFLVQEVGPAMKDLALEWEHGVSREADFASHDPSVTGKGGNINLFEGYERRQRKQRGRSTAGADATKREVERNLNLSTKDDPVAGAPGARGTNVDKSIQKAAARVEKMNLTESTRMTKILTGFLVDYFGYEHDVIKNYSMDQIFAEMSIQGSINPKEIAENMGLVDSTIADMFRETFTGSGPTQEFVRLATKWVKGVGPKRIPKLWSDSKNPVEAMDLITKKKIIEALIPTAKPNMRLKVNKKIAREAQKVLGKKKSSVQTIKRKRPSSKSKIVAGVAAKKSAGRKRKKAGPAGAAARTYESPIALRNLINEALPQMVASKMSRPALQYRTGRFANSARVEQLLVGPRGGVNVDYTYMKNPYQTFEPGFKQGSTTRDPRKIIGESIRELAMGILGRQPHTIRRT